MVTTHGRTNVMVTTHERTNVMVTTHERTNVMVTMLERTNAVVTMLERTNAVVTMPGRTNESASGFAKMVGMRTGHVTNAVPRSDSVTLTVGFCYSARSGSTESRLTAICSISVNARKTSEPTICHGTTGRELEPRLATVAKSLPRANPAKGCARPDAPSGG